MLLISERGGTERVLEQGKALVRGIEALDTIKPSGSVERVIVWLLLQAYRPRLRAIVASAPTRIPEEVLSASERIGQDRAAVWLSEN